MICRRAASDLWVEKVNLVAFLVDERAFDLLSLAVLDLVRFIARDEVVFEKLEPVDIAAKNLVCAQEA